jgi:hypothetical protein
LEALNHRRRRLDGGGATLRTDRDGAGLVVSVRLCMDTGPLFALGG